MNFLTNRAFLISSPHGGPQVLSYGKTAVAKYLLVERLTEDGHLTFGVEKLTDISKGIQNRNSLRQMLMYSADTCPGSSGAPVITFKYVNTDTQGHQSFEMERWMHYGYYMSEDINVSYFKVCSNEDLNSWGWKFMDTVDNTLLPVEQMTVNEYEQIAVRESVQIAVNESQQLPQLQQPVINSFDNSDATASAFDAGQYPHEATGLLEPPAYPAFITKTQRLKSFVKWLYHNIFEPILLAEAGFFYAGYADCVRCHQCGIGLRSWKPGDDIYVQHQRLRPSCTFLQALLRANTSGRQDGSHETPRDNTTDITGTSTATIEPTQSNSSNGRKILETLISEIQVPVATETQDRTEAQIQESTSDSTNSIPNESNSSNPRKYLETLIDEIQAPDALANFNSTDARNHGELERTSQPNGTVETSSTGNDFRETSLEAIQQQTPLVDKSKVLLRLLGKEKESLECLTKCRHCKVNPIQELFLPCGELYACSQCAEIFTHCPSCGKRILGTVTTYFS